MKKLFYLFSLIMLLAFSSCENQDWSFPDYGRTTVYLLINIRFVPSYWVMMKYLIIRSTISTNVL